MTESSLPPGAPEGQDEVEGAEKKKREKKDKVRSAWISFAGRIVAQVVGAAATSSLGLFLATRLQAPSGAPQPSTTTSDSHAVSRTRDGATWIAVLPLQNLSGAPEQEYFADGMTEALITDLSRVRALRVISRTSIMQYKQPSKTVPEIARELGVDVVLEGSVFRSGNRVRVTAQLIDAASDEHLWADNFDRDLRDVLALQDDVSAAIVRAVKVALTPVEQARLSRTRPVNPEAHLAYLKGRHAWNRRTVPDLEAAREFFEDAIARDPSYAPAHAGLADTFGLLGSFAYGALTPREAFPLARAEAEKALALDETLAEAHVSLAWSLFRFAWDFKAAERSFRRAIELKPSYATAHQWYAHFLAAQDRPQEALVEAQLARDYDPLSSIMYRNLALVHYMARRYDAAVESAERGRAREEETSSRDLLLPMARLERGERAVAIALYEDLRKRHRAEDVLGQLGNAYARDGQRPRAIEVLVQLDALTREHPLSPHHAALVYVGLGDRDSAFTALAKAVEERSDFLVYLKVHPLFDPLRSDPRFSKLVRKVSPAEPSAQRVEDSPEPIATGVGSPSHERDDAPTQ